MSDAHISRGSSAPSPPGLTGSAQRSFVFRAQLCGGRASGWTVELQELSPAIAVFADERGMTAIDAGADEDVTWDQEGFVGLFRLVEPVGPETPRYVGTAP